MKKIYATGDKGVIERIEEEARKNPSILELEEHNPATKRVKASLVSYDIFRQNNADALEEYYSGIKSRAKRVRAIKNAKEREVTVPHSGLKRRLTLERNSAMNVMIMDRTWNQELADTHDISKENVYHYYSVHIRMQVFINNEVDRNFYDEIAKKAKEAYDIEIAKKKWYEEGISGANVTSDSFLIRLLTPGRFKQANPVPPRLILEELLYGHGIEGRSKFVQLQEERVKYHTIFIDNEEFWMYGEDRITQHTYRKNRAKLLKDLKNLEKKHQKYRNWLLTTDNEANDHMTYIKAVGLDNLKNFTEELTWLMGGIFESEEYKDSTMSSTEILIELRRKRKEGTMTKGEKKLLVVREKTFPTPTQLHVTSVGQGTALIKKYASWHRQEYAEEIKATQDEEKAKTTKILNDRNRALARTKNQDKHGAVIKCYRKGKRNAVAISKLTEVSERTVRNIIKAYQQVEEFFVKGETNAQFIQEKTGTNLRMVIFYLEILSDGEITATKLRKVEQVEIDTQKQEEEQARVEALEREVRIEEQAKKLKQRLKLEKEITRLHKRGYNPTCISKMGSGKSAIDIKHILIGLELTPHFDPKIATQPEKDAYVEKLREKNQKEKDSIVKLDWNFKPEEKKKP